MGAWFRMYEGVLDDPKVQRLPAETFKGWVNLLCLAKRHNGVLPPISDIAFALRISEKECGKLLTTLVSAGLIDQDETDYAPHNWGERQYQSDVSTERVKRFRQRSMKQDETVSETPSEQSRTETETEQTEFTQFWNAYPRKVGRGQALKAFKTALKKTTAPVLLAALGSIDKSEPKFIPHAATWLNGERWLDEKPGASNGHALNDDDRWRARLKAYAEKHFWPETWGSKPGNGCSAPASILQEFGLQA